VEKKMITLKMKKIILKRKRKRKNPLGLKHNFLVALGERKV
jgi:hypothetical protein